MDHGEKTALPTRALPFYLETYTHVLQAQLERLVHVDMITGVEQQTHSAFLQRL